MTGLKFSRPVFALLVTVTTAAASYLSALVALYEPSAVTVVTIPFIGAISGGLVTFLATEGEKAPP